MYAPWFEKLVFIIGIFAIFVTCKYSSLVNRGATSTTLIYNIISTTEEYRAESTKY